MGILVGKQEGRILKCAASFEINTKMDPKTSELSNIDIEFAVEKTKMIEECYKSGYEMVGWYSVGPEMKPYKQDAVIHASLGEFSENPVYLLMDPTIDMIKDNELAVKVFELHKDPSSDKTQKQLVEIEYEVDPSKSESISIDHLTKNISTTAHSKFSENLSTTVNSLKVFNEKIDYILTLLSDPSKTAAMLKDGSMQKLKQIM